MAKQAFDGKRMGGVFRLDPDDLVIIGLDTSDGEEHPYYDHDIEKPIPEGFIKNLMGIGVREPIHIIKDPDHPGTGVVVGGRKRTRGLREANKRLLQMGEPPHLIPCIYERGEESDFIALDISTNEHHYGSSELTRARKVKRLLNRGMDTREVAVHCGVTPQTIRNWVKFLELSEPTKKAVDDGKLSMSAALDLHGMPVKEQDLMLRKLLATTANSGKKPTSKEVKKEKAKKTGKRATIAPSKRLLRSIVDDANIAAGHPDFAMGVAYALGDVDPKTLPWLEEAILNHTKKPAKKKGK